MKKQWVTPDFEFLVLNTGLDADTENFDGNPSL